MKDGNGGITPDERAAWLLLIQEKNLAHAGEVKARGRDGEHIYTITAARWMRWNFDPELVQRSALIEDVRNSPGGLGWKIQSLPGIAQDVITEHAADNRWILPPPPWPEVTRFLDAAPNPDEDIMQHGKEAIQALRLRPTCHRSERLRLLRWVETMDTLTVHYLSRAGGGQLTREDAAAKCDLDDRTFRNRLQKLRRWDLIGSAKKPPVKLPTPRN